MEVTSKTFLAILKSSLLGQKTELSEDILTEDWQKLFSMASIHSVLPMFYEAVYASPFTATIKCAIRYIGKASGYATGHDADYADE